jgi:hypothetical protein
MRIAWTLPGRGSVSRFAAQCRQRRSSLERVGVRATWSAANTETRLPTRQRAPRRPTDGRWRENAHQARYRNPALGDREPPARVLDRIPESDSQRTGGDPRRMPPGTELGRYALSAWLELGCQCVLGS